MNAYFHFRQFTIYQDRCAQKVSEVACVFGAWIPLKNKATRVLDIGGGTGLLSLMLAQRFPGSGIESIEMDPHAFQQMKENFEASPFANQLLAIPGDIRNTELSGSYEAIVVNPPFFENQLKSPSATKNRAWHSDSLSLQELLASLIRFLAPQGQAYLLWPVSREAELKNSLVNSTLHIGQVLRLAHSAQHPVRHLFIELGFDSGPIHDSTLFLREGTPYTPAVKSMLQDFYIKEL